MHDCNCNPELDRPVEVVRRVPSGARGGLGNIKAKDQSRQPSFAPSSYRFNLIGSFVKSSFSSSSGSASSRSGSSSSRSCSSSEMAPRGSTLSVNTRDTREWSSACPSPIEERSECTSASEPNSPMRPLSIQTTHTFGSATTPGAPVSVGSEYKAHLSEDARHRADRKRSQLAREKERKELAGKKDEDNDMFMRVRTGRGGAAVIVRADGSRIDSSSHPVTADIIQMKEAQVRALEESLFAASRARAMAAGSTGRGGSGNIGPAGKKKAINARKLAKMERAAAKGKGKATDLTPLTNEARAMEEAISHRDAASPVHASVGDPRDRHRTKKGIGRIWRRMAGSGGEGERTSGVAELQGGTEEDQLHLRSSPTARSVDTPSAETSPGINEQRSRRTGSTGHRQGKASRQPEEGAELLAFVNAELRGMGSSRPAWNVLGVAGTPGFPSDRHQLVTNPNSSTLKGTPPLSSLPLVQSDEEWVNDDGTPTEDEDSDIDPSFSSEHLTNHDRHRPKSVLIHARDSSSSGLTAVSTDTFGQTKKVVIPNFDSAPIDDDRKNPMVRAKITPFPLSTPRTRTLGTRSSSRVTPHHYHLSSGSRKLQSIVLPSSTNSFPHAVRAHRISASTHGGALNHRSPPPAFPIPRTPEMVS